MLTFRHSASSEQIVLAHDHMITCTFLLSNRSSQFLATALLSSWLLPVAFTPLTNLIVSFLTPSPRHTPASQGSKNLFSNTRQGGSKRKVLVAKVAL